MIAHLLYVEDDASLSFVTKDNLELKGYKVTHFDNGQNALDDIKINNYDLCIFDVMLPGVDGFTLAEELRKIDQDVPIIFLTAKSLKEDRIKGLKLGADDYMTKPYSIEELFLKVEIFLRRSKFGNSYLQAESQFNIGEYTLDHNNLYLTYEEKKQNLTRKEADLLKYLIQNKNNVLERSLILKKLWGEDDYFLGRSLDVFISRLRKYLKNDPTVLIENIHGVGFRLKG